MTLRAGLSPSSERITLPHVRPEVLGPGRPENQAFIAQLGSWGL